MDDVFNALLHAPGFNPSGWARGGGESGEHVWIALVVQHEDQGVRAGGLVPISRVAGAVEPDLA